MPSIAGSRWRYGNRPRSWTSDGNGSARIHGEINVTEVTSFRLNDYVEHRSADRKSTINRELAALRRLLRVGAQASPRIVPWDAIPRIRLADESDLIRTVFIDDDVWAQLRRHMAPHLRPLFTLAFWIGSRRGELLNLQRSRLICNAARYGCHPDGRRTKAGWFTLLLKR